MLVGNVGILSIVMKAVEATKRSHKKQLYDVPYRFITVEEHPMNA